MGEGEMGEKEKECSQIPTPSIPHLPTSPPSLLPYSLPPLLPYSPTPYSLLPTPFPLTRTLPVFRVNHLRNLRRFITDVKPAYIIFNRFIGIRNPFKLPSIFSP